MGELSQINGQDQVTGSSTISMIGTALSTTWVNAYSKGANRQTSHHYLQTAQKMAENMAFLVDSDGAETYRSLVNECRIKSTQPELRLHATRPTRAASGASPPAQQGRSGSSVRFPP